MPSAPIWRGCRSAIRWCFRRQITERPQARVLFFSSLRSNQPCEQRSAVEGALFLLWRRSASQLGEPSRRQRQIAVVGDLVPHISGNLRQQLAHLLVRQRLVDPLVAEADGPPLLGGAIAGNLL